MANRSDPLINSVSGSDPQNCLEYITRQRIYDSRYWKEVCFGLSVSDVLEKSIQQLQCVGSIPYMTFISLLLKLLQSNVEYDIIYESFLQHNSSFKYTTILGCVYIRLYCRPIEIYTSLESYYNDYRTIRVYDGGILSNDITKPFTTTTVDQIIHQLLTSTHIFGITLPRLPSRRTLYDSNYLPTIRRPTALANILSTISTTTNNDNSTSTSTSTNTNTDDDDDDDDTNNVYYDQLTERLRQKAFDEKIPSAIMAWEKRQQKQQLLTNRNTNNNATTTTTNTTTKTIHVKTIDKTVGIMKEKNHSKETTFEKDVENDQKEDSIQQQQCQSSLLLKESEQQQQQVHSHNHTNAIDSISATATTSSTDQVVVDEDDMKTNEHIEKHESKKKKSKKDKRNYDNLFKKKDKTVTTGTSGATNNSTSKLQKQIIMQNNGPNSTSSDNNNNTTIEQHSDEYWNQERNKLGLKPLK